MQVKKIQQILSFLKNIFKKIITLIKSILNKFCMLTEYGS